MFRSVQPLISLLVTAVTASSVTQEPELEGAGSMINAESVQARQACAKGGSELRQRIVAGAADARQEAETAVARGCFGLISTFNSIPRGVGYAPGIECSPSSSLLRYGRLGLLSFAGRDIVLEEEEAQREQQELAVLEAFALDYNARIVAHPNFPYRDLCRLTSADYRPTYHYSEGGNVTKWGLRPLEETDEPRNIHEAARRGSLASLQRLVTERPGDLNALDLLDLTPLAWAVIYRRASHVALLLEAGANPYGASYRDRPIDTSPLTLAREAGRDDLEALMLAILE